MVGDARIACLIRQSNLSDYERSDRTEYVKKIKLFLSFLCLLRQLRLLSDRLPISVTRTRGAVFVLDGLAFLMALLLGAILCCATTELLTDVNNVDG